MSKSPLRWLALYVKSRHEKQVTVHLAAKGYEVFLPTYINRCGSGKSYILPLFATYVFCRSDPAHTVPIRTTPSVYSIVGNASGPLPVSDEQISQLNAIVNAGKSHEPWDGIYEGAEIEIGSGAFKGVRGVVLDISDTKWLVVSISLLGRSVAVKLDREGLASHRTGAQWSLLSGYESAHERWRIDESASSN